MCFKKIKKGVIMQPTTNNPVEDTSLYTWSTDLRGAGKDFASIVPVVGLILFCCTSDKAKTTAGKIDRVLSAIPAVSTVYCVCKLIYRAGVALRGPTGLTSVAAQTALPSLPKPRVPVPSRDNLLQLIRLYSEVLARHPGCYVTGNDPEGFNGNGGAFRVAASSDTKQQILNRMFSVKPENYSAYIDSMNIVVTGDHYHDRKIDFGGGIGFLEIGYATYILKTMINQLSEMDDVEGGKTYLLENTRFADIIGCILADSESIWHKICEGVTDTGKRKSPKLVYDAVQKGFPYLNNITFERILENMKDGDVRRKVEEMQNASVGVGAASASPSVKKEQ